VGEGDIERVKRDSQRKFEPTKKSVQTIDEAERGREGFCEDEAA
jgi:hypothetical protein